MLNIPPGSSSVQWSDWLHCPVNNIWMKVRTNAVSENEDPLYFMQAQRFVVNNNVHGIKRIE